MGTKTLSGSLRILRGLFRQAVQQGRSKRRGDAYSLPYVEPLSATRTPLADFINSLLMSISDRSTWLFGRGVAPRLVPQ